MNSPSEINYPMSTLYVGDLDHSVTEAQLLEKFQPFGPIVTIRVCRDAITGVSLEYAYVNFHLQQDAAAALDRMNFELINGRPMRLMWSKRNPSLRRSGVGNVFVNNLEQSITSKELYDTFASFGDILSCKVALDDNNQSKGYGFVHYVTEESARYCIDQVNGMLLNGQQVYVGPFIARQERSGIISSDFTNIYVKSFGKLTEEEFRKMFETFGPITSSKLVVGDTGYGFGFVNFEKSEDAKKAVEEMNGKKLIGGQEALYVTRAMKKIEREQELRLKYENFKRELSVRYGGKNLYVSNFGDTVDDEALRQKFEEFGTITSAKVMRDEDSRSKGFGFVCFSKSTEATEAMARLNGTYFGLRPLYVAIAQHKEERKASLTIIAHQSRLNNLYNNAQDPMLQREQQVLRFLPSLNVSDSQMRHPYSDWFGQMTTMRPVASANSSVVVPQPGQAISVRTTRRPNNISRRVQSQPTVNQSIVGQPQADVHSSVHPAQNQETLRVEAAESLVTAAESEAEVHFSIPPAQQQEAQAPVSLVTSELATTESDPHERMLGDKLFPIIGKMAPPHLVGRITQLLMLQLGSDECLDMMENEDSLRARVDEAIRALRLHDRADSNKA